MQIALINYENVKIKFMIVMGAVILGLVIINGLVLASKINDSRHGVE